MATKLYLHVGHPKCGSSTLQQALYDNRMTLQKVGIGVVTDKLDLMKSSSKLRFPVGYFRDLLLNLSEVEDAAERDERAAKELGEKFRGLARQAAALDLKALVISAENLARPPAIALLAEAKPYFDCEVIYYIRRHDEWLISSWLQWQFKTGISLDDFISQTLRAPRNALYRGVIDASIRHFSREKLRLRLLTPANLEGGNLVTDFWTAIGVRPDLMEPVKARNVSFSADLVGVLKESPYLFDTSHDNRLTTFLDEYHSWPRPLKKQSPLSRAQRQKILDHYVGEIKWLKNNFFGEEDLKAWLMNPGPERVEKPQTVTPEGLAEMLNLQLAILKDLREDVDKIKTRLGIS